MSKELINFKSESAALMPVKKLARIVSPTLATITNVSYEDGMRAVLKAIHTEMAGAGEKNLGTIPMIAQGFVEYWEDLKLPEIHAVMRMGLLGRFGRVSWGDVKPADVIGENGWASKYVEWTCELRESEHKKAKDSNNELTEAQKKIHHDFVMARLNKRK